MTSVGHTRAHPNYIGVFLGLAVLTAVELGVAFLPWSKTTIILLLLLLAVWKALMVALYFMHLRFETNRIRILAIAPLPLAVILVVAVIQEFR
ncbi:MAG TPA: cytochrome C oxidase subunit IV family protein [Gemmatimonadales bacterium]|jgi:cytochrome c oxidase subunit 4|nr:cytochrome C oxidase subunit IV family protein [Gemmatimonadales bacterium]